MTPSNALKLLVAVLTMSAIGTTSANSIGFGQDVYTSSSGQVSIDLVYDFSSYPIVGGGLDTIYDSSFIEFESFTPAPLASDVHPAVSPVGALTQPGLYSGVGIGYLGPFGGGITSANAIGTFVFSIIGTPTYSTPCGATLCIAGSAVNPFISVMGVDVAAELLENGIDRAEVVVPLPAALWLLLSSMVVLVSPRLRF